MLHIFLFLKKEGGKSYCICWLNFLNLINCLVYNIYRIPPYNSVTIYSFITLLPMFHSYQQIHGKHSLLKSFHRSFFN